MCKKQGRELWNTLALVWITVLGLASVCYAETKFCDAPSTVSEDEMRDHLHVTAVPRNLWESGYFEEDLEASDAATCIISCCDRPLCNVAWYTIRKCFTIECVSERACEPVSQEAEIYKETLFIQIRSVNETSHTDECRLHEDDCEEHEECVISESSRTRCRCMKGFTTISDFNRTCVPDVTFHTSPVECEYGVTICGSHRHCVLKLGSKSRQGTCQCENGYIENTEGMCVLESIDKGDKTDDFKIRNPGDVSNSINGHSENVPVTSVYGDIYSVAKQNGAALPFTGSTEGAKIGPTKAGTIKVTSPVPTTKSSFPPTKRITTAPVEQLTVSVGENKILQLPNKEVSLVAFTLPEESKEDPYHYDWTLEAHPEGENTGTMDGKNTNTLMLKDLIEGLYTFRVQVTGTNKFGDALVNVTVIPPARKNVPPVAKVRPTDLVVKLPNSAILDGSDSTDDDKIVSYLWEVVKGPLQDKSITGDKAILSLTDLLPGNYTFKLTVADSDGATNSTTANVTVIKETDYPPKANAGSDIVIHLPKNSVILSGNMSTDDKGIVSYEWIKMSGDELTADMQGTRTSELHLSNLQVGDYMFSLRVTDGSGQMSEADIHVYVKPEENTPPVAITAVTVEMSLPLDSILLDGSNSTDDQKVTSYLWQQIGGPTTLVIRDSSEMVTEAAGEIKVGKYEFKLTVKDVEQLTSSATLTVQVKKVANEPPVAHAGGNLEVQLPLGLVTLDGSQSTDDHRITGFHWQREPGSLAAGDILNNSDHQAVLQLVNLVAGRYVFTLNVVDGEGLSSSDKASLVVKEDPHKKDLMELELEADITTFTQDNKEKLEGQLTLLLPRQPEEGETRIDIQTISMDTKTGNLRVLFYAMNVLRDTRTYRSGVSTLAQLKEKLLSSANVLDFTVANLDTLVCQKNCSNHGHCDMKTKLCICEPFWTANVILYRLHGESNCDWSILYVVIVGFLIVIFCTGAIWGLVFCWQRKRCRCSSCRLRTSRKRHRYSLLQDGDEEETVELKSGKKQNSSLMVSESDFSSEEETIFVNNKKSNGHIGKLNGVSKQYSQNSLKT
ncbi:dyslexia-associated protein KIAA0319-like protein [Mya arenaria]|uniref:dyslexia-associated protein KIAA0319-like protein n=1 Tax=Mya arenaria TaxID=6604 RepID=UPI0022E88F78|nr:dyslexia-associated protein KIAA0319-like protein [Mya arenaria]XP_052763496.1 dyslexia-associated protein KIAA0319-like protein [Mya arenaria]